MFAVNTYKCFRENKNEMRTKPQWYEPEQDCTGSNKKMY